MKLDRDLFLDVLTDFDAPNDLSASNPFDWEEIFSYEGFKLVDGPITAFLEGCAVPETARHLPPHALNEHSVAFAIAGILQGLAIGFEYALRSTATQEET
jgi:hypothetical protein